MSSENTKIPIDWDVDVIEYWNASLSSYKKHHQDPEQTIDVNKVTIEFMNSLPVKQRTTETEPVVVIPNNKITPAAVKRKELAPAPVPIDATQESQIGNWSFVVKEQEEEYEEEEAEENVEPVEEEYIGEEPASKKARYDQYQQDYYQRQPPPPMMPQNNEGLSNLIMAWYYAGYYTGLYQAGNK